MLLFLPDQDASEAVKSLALELTPRTQDSGRLSVWRFENGTERERAEAAYAARRPHRQKLDTVVLMERTIMHARVELTRDSDTETFACVGDDHRSLLISDASAAERLARAIVGEL